MAKAKTRQATYRPDAVVHQPDNMTTLTLDGTDYVLRGARSSEFTELSAMLREIQDVAQQRFEERIEPLAKREADLKASGNGSMVEQLRQRMHTARLQNDVLEDPEGDAETEERVIAWWRRAFELLEVNGQPLPGDTDEDRGALPLWLGRDLTLIASTVTHWAKASVRSTTPANPNATVGPPRPPRR